MQLITILLGLTAVLTFLSGLSVWAGAKKSEKKSSKYFTFSVFFAAIWAISIAVFSCLQPGANTDFVRITIFGIYIPALFMDVCLMVYCGYPYKSVRAFGVLMAMLAAVMTGLVIYDPNILYKSFILDYEGNSVVLNQNWYYYCYAAFYFVNTVVLLTSLFFRVRKTRNKGLRNGLIIIGAGTAIAGALMLVFDVLLPLTNYSLIWVGPMALSIVMVAHYYAVLKYRIISLNSGWLKILSYIIILATAGTIYMLLFYIIFTALFKTPNPAPAIFVFNFLMIAVILLLLPAINEISSFIRSLISMSQIDVRYVAKKLHAMGNEPKININELAGFLADHLHFDYIGILVKGKLYGSEAKPMSASDLKTFTKLAEPKRGIWQYLDADAAKIAEVNEFTSVAILTDKNGKIIGQIIFGKPQGKISTDRRDLIQLEMLINLASATINGEK